MTGHIILKSWRIFRVTRSTAGLQFVAVGYTPHLDDVLISGNIKSWDAETSMLLTTKGEKVKLEGEPGRTREADHAWDRWVARHGVKKDPVDVSSRYYRGRVVA